MKPFKDQGWVYYDRCKTIMYASKARGGRAFFAGVGSAVASGSSGSGNTAMAPVESTISIDHTPGTDPSINSFGMNMSNAIASLNTAQSQVKPAFPPFGHASVMGDDGEVISVSSSSYGIKCSHHSTTTTSTPPSSQSLTSQPP